MAERAIPAAAAPRTVTVRVRSIVIAAVAIAAAVATSGSLRWATGLQPIAAASSSAASIGLAPYGHAAGNPLGPDVFRWARGGRYVVAITVHNTSSVPITITGADHTPAAWDGEFTGPALGIPDEHRPALYSPFHPVRLPADGLRSVSLIFTANPRACRSPAGRTPGFGSQDSVTLHFTSLGVFHGTQTVSLGDMTVNMAAPTRADCT